MPELASKTQVHPVEFKEGDILDALTGEVLVTHENPMWHVMRDDVLVMLGHAPNRGKTFLIRWAGDHQKGLPPDVALDGLEGLRSGKNFVHHQGSQVGLYRNLSARGQCLALVRIWEVQSPPSS